MAAKYRIPITAITVFGTSSLLLTAVAIVLYLGFNQAAQTTRQLWAHRSETLIDHMERGLDSRLEPVRDQALWIAADIRDLSDPAGLDDYMLGALAATPQVAGIAVITRDGASRRWHRDKRVAIDEDWSQRDWFGDYIKQVEREAVSAWREPIFTDTINSSTLLHDTPLYAADGRFIGVLAQIVPLRELSAFLAQGYSDTGITPFVLYNRDYILAHPAISAGSEQQPLATLDELGDLLLARIWTPDEEAAFIQTALRDTRARGVLWGDDYILYLYRDIERYGPAPWTLGAYLNTSLLPDEQTPALIRALTAGLAVLLLAMLVSIWVGRKVSSPVKALVRAADLVNSGKLNQVPQLGDSRIRELDEAGKSFNRMVGGLRERKLIRDTLGRFVPEKVASSLLAGGGKLSVQQTEATILFCDIEAFTRLTEAVGPIRIVEVLNAYFSDMVDILETQDGVVTQFQGDAILATFNVPVADAAHARKAIIAAREMLQCVDSREFESEKLNIRIGINTGSVVAGAIGARGRLNYTVHGDAVNLAARLESMNKQYGTRLLVADSTTAQVSDIEFTLVDETPVRGQSRAIKLFTLASSQAGD